MKKPGSRQRLPEKGGRPVKTDIHVHLIPPSLAAQAGTPAVEPEALEAQCRRSGGAERAVIQGWPFRDMEDCRTQNQAALQARRARPDFFRCFCVVSPAAGEAALAEAESCLDAGCSGVGELDPVRQGFSLENPVFQKLCALCEERGRVLCLHMDMSVGREGGGGTVLPADCLRLIEAHPNLRLLLPHYGGGLPFYALMPEVARKLENVWFDAAPDGFALLPRAADCARLCLGANRLLFGSHRPGPVFDAGPCWDLPEEWEGML